MTPCLTSVLGLKLFGVIHGVVDQGEAGGLATSKVGLEPEHEDPVGCAVVHLGQLLSHVGLATEDLPGWRTSTTICLLQSRRLSMYLRVLMVTLPSIILSSLVEVNQAIL